MKNKILSIILFLITLGVGPFAHSISKSPFELMWDDSTQKILAGENFSLSLTIRAPEKHYLYAEETDVDFVSLDGIIITDIKFPKPSFHDDPYLKKRVKVFEGDIKIGFEGRVPKSLSAGVHDLVARVTFRGCSDELCFRPEERDAVFSIDVVAASAGGGAGDGRGVPEVRASEAKGAEVAGLGLKNLLDIQDFSILMERGLVLTLMIVFFAGVLTSLTPCVWPVIPIVLLYIGVHPHKRFMENITLALTFVFGLVIVYSALGILAVALGKNLGFLFQSRAFLAIVVVFFLTMSLSMFGVFHLRLPQKLHHKLHKLGGKGYRGAFLAGMGTGLVASPCSGPMVAALLGYVALQRDYLYGFLLLIVYGAGMGLLIMILGACYGEFAGKFRSGVWMVWIKRLLGVVLLFPAVFYMGSLFNWSRAGFAPSHEGPRIEWATSESGALKIAAITNRPVMVEFGASWCPPCIALENNFFSRPEIVELSHRLVPLRIDATVETKEVKELAEKYDLSSLPTVLFLSPKGEPYVDLGVRGPDKYDEIEKAMKEAIRRSSE